MAEYFETDEIRGYAPFKCYVCGKMLIADVHGEYTIELECPRCKTKITLKTQKIIPDTLAVKHGELTRL